jgi:hypothetical protein
MGITVLALVAVGVVILAAAVATAVMIWGRRGPDD